MWHLPIIYFCFFYFDNFYYYFFFFFNFNIIYLNLFIYEKNKTFLYSKYLIIIYFFLISFISSILFFNQNHLKNFIKINNYFEKNFNLNERSKMDLKITKQNNFSNSKLYLFGDSLSHHYIPMLNNSKLIDNYYGKNLFDKICRNINVDICDFSKLNLFFENENYQNKIILFSFHTNYNDIYVKNLLSFVKSINKNIYIIFINPQIQFANTPEACLLKNKKCEKLKSEVIKDNIFSANILKDLRNKNSNIFIFDYMEYICPGISCKIYDKEKDLLFYRDRIHLSNEGSKYLSGFFDTFIRQNGILNQ